MSLLSRFHVDLLPALALGTLVLAAPAFTPAASAQTITFDNLPRGNGDTFTTYSEGPFTVFTSSGDVYLAKSFGNPVPSLLGLGQFSIDVVRTGGGYLYLQRGRSSLVYY